MEKRNVTIHRNAIESFFMSLKDFIKHHRNPVLIGFIAVVLLSGTAIGGAFYYDYSSLKDLHAYEKLVADYEAGAKDENAFKVMIGKLTTLVDSSKFGYVSRHGNFLIAGYYFDNKHYDEAMKYFEKYANSSSSVYAPLALLQAGACAEETDKYDKAFEFYKKAESKYKDSPFSDRILYDLGRMYQKKGDDINARESYNKILTLYPKSSFAAQAKARMFLIGLFK
jgi:tetratricopeptide (TPR) repeat protein